jgi:1-acyl-sn-glycerol-3-phosphate acyltransferase
MKTPADVKSLTRYITKEIYSAFGLSSESWLRFILNPLFHWPAGRFSQVAAHFDQDVSQYGFREAVRRILPWFASDYKAIGVENIPRQGPLLLASNHPGTCDSLVITANIPRDDLKIIVTGIPFVQGLPCAAEHLIYVPREGPGRANVIRQAIRHLKNDGAVLIFPSGTIDPDPELAPDPEITFERWSPSVEMMLRYVPQARVLLSMVSGVLSSNWVRHPLTRLGNEAVKQRRIAEFMQVIQQMIFPQSVEIHPTVTFGEPLQVSELASQDLPLLDGLLQRGRQLLDTHIQGFKSEATAQDLAQV